MTEVASGYERQDLEKYYTPEWVTEALCSVEIFLGTVSDPAAGAHDMVRVLGRKSIAFGSDLDEGREFDFLIRDPGTDHIVTNPPYGKQGKLAERFIARALELTRPGRGKVAMLLRVDFDSAKTRRPLFGHHPAFACKYVLTRRIQWANLPQTNGATQNHAWFVWDWQKAPAAPTRLAYLPRAA